MISLKKITAGNIAFSISDHLTQFLIIRNQTTNFENNRKKEVPKIRKFNKKISYQILHKLTGINTGKYLKMIQTYPLICSLEKLISYIINILR